MFYVNNNLAAGESLALINLTYLVLGSHYLNRTGKNRARLVEANLAMANTTIVILKKMRSKTNSEDPKK